MELMTLVERARQGDATAFGHLVTQHWRFVYTICLSHVGHAAEAEDLTQDVFTRVSHDLTDLRAPDKFLPWLHQVTKNVCRMWRRRQRTTAEPLDTIAEVGDPAAAARLRRSELGEIVQAMLAQLSPTSREVLALHYPRGVLGGRAGGGVWGVALDHQESPPRRPRASETQAPAHRAGTALPPATVHETGGTDPATVWEGGVPLCTSLD
jgi:RNA polymerase sigma factor (sigma-70 family)